MLSYGNPGLQLNFLVVHVYVVMLLPLAVAKRFIGLRGLSIHRFKRFISLHDETQRLSSSAKRMPANCGEAEL